MEANTAALIGEFVKHQKRFSKVVCSVPNRCACFIFLFLLVTLINSYFYEQEMPTSFLTAGLYVYRMVPAVLHTFYWACFGDNSWALITQKSHSRVLAKAYFVAKKLQPFMKTVHLTKLETFLMGHRTPVCHEYQLTIMYHRTTENTRYCLWWTHCCSHGKRTNLVTQCAQLASN